MLKLSRNTRPDKKVTIAKAQNELFWDLEGKQYIDISSQTLNLLFGQAHPVINQFIFETLSQCTFIDQDFISPQHERAIIELADLLPSHLTVFNLRMNDGSSAVECAVKQARRATGRSRVLTVDGIYLGQNSQVIHFRGWGKRPEDLLIGSTEDVVFSPIPYPDYRISFKEAHNENGKAIAELIYQNRHLLGCVLLDPVMISCGVSSGRNMQEFLFRAYEMCFKYKIPLIFDECQSFGWVPNNTLAKHYDIEVDMLVLGKGIGGGLPLSVCAFKEEFDNLHFGDADYTNGGTLASIAGLQAVCHLLKQQNEQEHFNRLSKFIQEKIKKYAEEKNKKIVTRGIGLINAIEILFFELREQNILLTKKISQIALDKGVFIRTHMNCLTIKPPRTTQIQHAELALDIIFSSIDQVYEELVIKEICI
jgi:4-aminobutyrate aminotransferase-like enzyme